MVYLIFKIFNIYINKMLCTLKLFRCYYAPLEKEGILFCNCRSVCRSSVVRSISFDPFTWSIPNLVQLLPSMSRWSPLIFRSYVQRSRSNHFFELSMLSAQYIPIPCLLASDSFCFYREDKPEFCTMGGIYVSETFLVFTLICIPTCR